MNVLNHQDRLALIKKALGGNLRPSSLRLYLLLVLKHPENPSYYQIARSLRMADSTISRAIKQLVEFDVITYHRSKTPHESNTYHLKLLV